MKRATYLVDSISNHGSSAMGPSLKELVLEVHARNLVARRLVNKITQSATQWQLEVSNTVDHVATLFGTPFRVGKLLVLTFCQGLVLADDEEANAVVWHIEERPGVLSSFLNDHEGLGAILQEVRVLFRIQRVRSTNEACESLVQVPRIAGRQDVLVLQTSVEGLPHCRVRAISSNQNVTMIGGAVGTADHGSFLVLNHGEDLLAVVDVLRRYL